jgi:hypothetical protein
MPKSNEKIDVSTHTELPKVCTVWHLTMSSFFNPGSSVPRLPFRRYRGSLLEVRKPPLLSLSMSVSSIESNFVVRFVIAPLDVVKIRLQLQAHGTGTLKDAVVDGPTYRGIGDTMRTIVRQEGIRGLWKGNIPAELLYMTYGPAQFVALKECTLFLQRTTPQIPEDLRNGIAGGVAGAVATAATYPFDLLRTRFAAQGSQKVWLLLIERRHGWHLVTMSRFTRPFCTRFTTSTSTKVCEATTAA